MFFLLFAANLALSYS